MNDQHSLTKELHLVSQCAMEKHRSQTNKEEGAKQQPKPTLVSWEEVKADERSKEASEIRYCVPESMDSAK
jgi:hypothetical protein